jgi:hypothetical protein
MIAACTGSHNTRVVAGRNACAGNIGRIARAYEATGYNCIEVLDHA